MCERRELWMAVLQRAVTDAIYIGNNKLSLLDKQQAHAWITGAGRDFQIVCAFAGIDPEYFRDAYMSGRIIQRTPRGRQAKSLPEDFVLTEEAA